MIGLNMLSGSNSRPTQELPGRKGTLGAWKQGICYEAMDLGQSPVSLE